MSIINSAFNALIRRYFVLDRQSKELKDELDAIKAQIVDTLVTSNLDEYVTDSGECVRKIDAENVSYTDTQKVIKLLVENGYGQFVVNSVAKNLNDEIRNNTDVGKLVKPYVEIKTVHRLSSKLVA